MHIVLVDDSIPFDGATPASLALGGAEKAFAGLPGALARRGHRVQVFNRATAPATIEDAAWESWQGSRPVACDVLIAYRKPDLLGFIATAQHRILWLADSAVMLETESHRGLLYAHRPTLVFMGEAHKATYRARDVALKTVAIPPGIGRDFRVGDPAPSHPPYGIATCHPLFGLDWLIRLWVERVHPLCPHGSLHIHSAVLDQARTGGAVPGPFKAIADQALAAQDKGIVIRRPGADPAMAEAYRGARVHLYPGDKREVYAYTLAESQACGTPGLARPFAATAEAVADGISGHFEAEAEGFARRALNLLEDDGAYRSLAAAARQRGAARDWDKAADAFEVVWR